MEKYKNVSSILIFVTVDTNALKAGATNKRKHLKSMQKRSNDKKIRNYRECNVKNGAID